MAILEMQEKLSLKTPLRYLKGVGPERSKILARIGLHALEDLFYFFPRRYEDRFPVKKISELSMAGKECVGGMVTSRGVIRRPSGRTIFRAVITEGKKSLFAVYFNQPYLSKVFLPKSKILLYGSAEREGKLFQMIHPEYEIISGDSSNKTIHAGRIVPIYPLTEDLSQKGLRQLLFRATEEMIFLIHDPLTSLMRRRLRLRDSAFAFHQIHFPEDAASREQAYRRLVFDEFFWMQLLVQMRKVELQRENPLLAHAGSEEKVRQFLETLGFELTSGQKDAIEDILRDMNGSRPMNRLVQGDVGSGKTAVAAAALVFMAANGFQGALMAPTEVLAQQHYFTLSRLLEPLGISVEYLAQGMPAEAKERVLAHIAAGETPIVVGTHALIQENVRFRKLGLAVIDEQHKFGVFQRAALMDKGFGEVSATKTSADASGSSSASRAHFLLMTATPIPRTLALTLYGDLDLSTMSELPKGRQPVKTFWVGENKRSEIYALLDEALQQGRQGYVICPAIDENASFSTKNVLAAHSELQKIFAHRKVGLLHGRMKSQEKKRMMQEFKENRIQLLVSTVVVEVGVDVPNAVMMIIENAERFGLAQLHQLRGRVGRGEGESVCVLFSDAAQEESRERLDVFQKTQSGFVLAEKDMALRGAGDIAGARQHGLPELRIGDFSKDMDILLMAREEAKKIIEKDPHLMLSENRLLRKALEERYHLWEKKKLAVSA